MSSQKPIRRSLLDMGIARFAAPAPEQKWAVKSPAEEGGLLPAAAPILVVGRGGVGKTSAAVELALKIAAGGAQTWMGQIIAASGVSVVLTYEESTDRMHRMIQKMCAASGLDPVLVGARMIVKSYQDTDVVPMPLVGNDPQTRMPVPTAEYKALTDELRQIRAEVGEIACIVVDNAGTAMAIEGNDYQSANQAMKWLQRWSAEFNALVPLIAHTNKGALKFESDNPSDDELEAAAMGSTGWVSAVRLAMIMWSMSEEGEANIAKSLADEDFKPGTTRRRYIRARVVKSNIDDAYTGTLTLKRAGGTLEDVTGATKTARAVEATAELHEFAAAVGRLWARQTPVQKSGTNGVFERRGALGEQFARMSKSYLSTLADRALAAGVLRLEAVCPGVEKTRGAWLYDTTGQGRRDAYLHGLRVASRAADKSRVPFKTSNIAAWRKFLEPHMADLSDEEVLASIDDLRAARMITVFDSDGIIAHRKS